MATNEFGSETRGVRDFQRVVLKDYGTLAITQGDEESLTIETEADFISNVETEVKDETLYIGISAGWWDKVVHYFSGLVKKQIAYTLSVKRLTAVTVLGTARVSVGDLQTDRLAVTLGGAGDINITALTAELLEANLRGAGRIKVAGQVVEQKVTMGGAGNYDAAKLESKTARVDLGGVGKATVWAVEELEIELRGLGTVNYIGEPEVKQNVYGLGKVIPISAP